MKTTKCFCALLMALASICVSAAEEVAIDEAARIYRESCDSCHGEGVYGAPRPGVEADWAPRLSYGIDGLYLSAFEGIIPQMPARGLCMECSDAQLMAVVDLMIRDESIRAGAAPAKSARHDR
jgi:cytochrome c5